VIAGLLKKEGFELADSPDDAAVVIFNTCSVRQHAEDKVWSEIGRVSKLSSRKASQKKIIGLVGCMAQNYKDAAFKRMPSIDFVVGPADIAAIPDILKKLCAQAGSLDNRGLLQRKIYEVDAQRRPDEIYHTGFHQDTAHSFVVISEGCSNYCAYCVVPYTRGALRHRSADAIIREIEQACAAGITSATLLGQNVNAYDDAGVTFVQLLQRVDSIVPLKEFSFITSHPKDVAPDLFKVMASCAKLKQYLHLPVQAGSDRVLAAMNRGYTRAHYLELAARYRAQVPAGVLTTDVIVGFPGETDEDFQYTYRLVEEVSFDAAFIFKYSVRPHTDASRRVDDVPQKVKEERHAAILELQKKISRARALNR
jgi:tRNA-2-methylthio-N6-dimethylallyladenosine synthase